MQTIQLNDECYAALIAICNRNFRTAELQIKQWIHKEASQMGIQIPKFDEKIKINNAGLPVLNRTKKAWSDEMREKQRLRMKQLHEQGRMKRKAVKDSTLEKVLAGAFDD